MALKDRLERLHHRLGWLGATLLMLPILAWVLLAANEPVVSVFNGAVPRFVLSGDIVNTKFDIVHAGFVLDQPTIGKWLFWFTVMAVMSLPYAAVVAWLADRRRTSCRIAFAVAAVVLSGFLLCILSWPVCWLVQYIASMGVTPKRIAGLIYSAAGAAIVLAFLRLVIMRPKDRNQGERTNQAAPPAVVAPKCGA